MTRNNFHKIQEIVEGPVKALFFTWGRAKPWYYLVEGDRIESKIYRKMKHATGFKNE